MHFHRGIDLLSGRLLCSLVILSSAVAYAGGASGTAGAAPARAASVAFLYHSDPQVRIATIRALAAGQDSSLIDDLIRAYSVELWTPVRNVYEQVLREWTKQELSGPGAWKAWLQAQVEAGKLTRDYRPVVPADLDSAERDHLDPLALRLGPENLARCADVLRGRWSDLNEFAQALRYMVANDHLHPVREFLGSEWLGPCLTRQDMNVPTNILLMYLGSLATPGPLREGINAQVRRCLESTNPTILANTLRLLAGVEGGTRGLEVPGVADRVRALLTHSDPAVALQAQRALLRLDPRSLTSGPAKPPLASVTFLYHKDPEFRIATLRALAARQDPGLIDDLIRAYSVEVFRPVSNVYERVLPGLTQQKLRDPAAWKAWLQAQVEAGKLKIDYQPVVPAGLDPNQRDHLDPLALRLGPEHFTHFADVLLGRGARDVDLSQALRYMVANDHLDQVREFLGGEWLERCLARPDQSFEVVLWRLNSLADPGPVRERVNDRLRRCLDSDNPTVVANALHLLAGEEQNGFRWQVPGIADKVRTLVRSPDNAVAAQARRALDAIDPASLAALGGQVSYDEAFRDLYDTLGKEYPCFALKGIDWEAVGRELLPRVKGVKTDEEFGRLCLELVARLQDSHAFLRAGTAKVPWPQDPPWDGGFACLEDDQGRAVVYFVVANSPAARAGLAPGHIITRINDQPVPAAIEKAMRFYRTYGGFSSDRNLRYYALRLFARQNTQDASLRLETVDLQARPHRLEIKAALRYNFPPRLPVPSPGIADSGTVSWKKLDDDIGYIYVRRISDDLIERLDRAVGDLQTTRGLIIDVRGNTGGNFDSDRALLNFALDRFGVEPNRPRFRGPMALVIDEACISAGEGWASWFIAQHRARVFGRTTAGASSRKIEYTLKNGLYRVSLPVKAYTGYLDRPIESRGLEPDVPIQPKAEDIAQGRDTVLHAAQEYLRTQKPSP